MWEVVGLFIYFFGGQFKDQWVEGVFYISGVGYQCSC